MVGRVRISTWVVSEQRETVYNGTARQDNRLSERTSIHVPLVTADVRLTARFGLQASAAIPLIARTGVVPTPEGGRAFRDEVRGFGDTVVGAWYRAGSPSGWSWTLNGGVSLPTGATRTPRFMAEMEEGSLVPLSRLQRGSGTFDPIVGVSAERPAAGGRWVSGLAARAPFAENRDGLRIGASWEAGTGWAHTLLSHKVMAYGRVDWLHREQDVFNGTPVLVGGGDWIYLTPGVGVVVGKGINVQVDVKLPAYRSLANRQLDSAAIFQLGISRSF